MKIRVGVIGYGTVGKRVAWAVMKQPDMELVGVATIEPNWEVLSALKKGIKVYVPQQHMKKFSERGIVLLEQ